MKKIIILCFLIFNFYVFADEKEDKKYSDTIKWLEELKYSLDNKVYGIEFFLQSNTVPGFFNEDLKVNIELNGRKQHLQYIYTNKYFENSSLIFSIEKNPEIKYQYKKSYDNILEIFFNNNKKKENGDKIKTEKRR